MRNVDLEDELDDEPPPYAATTEKQELEPTGCQRDYFFSAPGALKLIEAVLSLIGFIACLPYFWPGRGFVIWVMISALITTIVLFVLKAMNIFPRLPGYWEVYEFVYLIIYSLKMAIACIIAGVVAVYHASIMATCVIAAVAFLIYALDMVMSYRRLKEARAERQREIAEGRATGNRRETHFCIIF